MTRVAHLTSVHPAFDTRIYHRECRALTEAGYDVVLVVADPSVDPGRYAFADVRSVRIPRRRMGRASVGAWRVMRAGRASGARLFHLHDPELLAVAPFLKLGGARVVYDAHEDLVEQVLGKGWIPSWLRPTVSRAASWILPAVTSRLDAVVAVTPDVAARHAGSKVTMVRNYPILSELEPAADAAPYVERPPRIAYVGGIGPARGCLEMARAVASLPATMPVELAMGGWFAPPSFEGDLRAAMPDDRLELLGTLDRTGVQALLSSSRVGLILDHPTPAYLRSFPVKMFEYMAAGVPIVASNFPLWEEIIDGAGCGILADPLDPASIAAAIETLLSDPVAARDMGARGRQAVIERFNWDPEAKALVGLYASLVGGP